MSEPMIIEPGTKFGRLTVIEKVEDYIGPNGKHRAQFRCKCDCGNEVIAKGSALKQGIKQSCGCLAKESSSKRGKTNATFGISHTPEAQAYYNMKNRIFNPGYQEYENYGGRGITICERWLDPVNGIKNFYDDMHPTYFPGGTLDRIDVNGNYEPSNCRWADHRTQVNNTTANVYIPFNGDMFTVAEVTRALGYENRELIRNRLRAGWSTEEAIYGKTDSKKHNPPMNAIYFINDFGRPVPENEYEEVLIKSGK